MKKEDDVQLIRKILSGNDDAFNTLVEKYWKSVHALVHRKIGDFQYAEEITQDTFLQVYKKLSTLKNPNKFAGWLYAIANRLCIAWMRKRKPTMQSLEDTSAKIITNVAYEHYVFEQRELEAAEHRYEIIQELLAKLPENERTVMMLYYFGEMTIKEIGKSLEVSVNTITSWLYRARKRLREMGEFPQMLSNNHQQNLATQIESRYQSGEFDKALEISARALKSNPPNLEAYSARWRLIVEMFPEEEAKNRICPEIAALLRTQSDTSEVLSAAYWGYMCLPDRTKNVPNSLFNKMLQYSKTELYLLALLGLAERSEDVHQEWHYYQQIIDKFAVSDVPVLSWYLLAHEEMLRLVETDPSLVSDDSLDELIDQFLEAHLAYCQDTEQYFGWAYTEAVKYRLKFNNRLDKALETLERAEIRLVEEEEQKWLVEHNKGSVEKATKNISRLRSEIYHRQERWKKAYDGLIGNAPDYLESLWSRYNENTINYFWMLGRSAEGIGEWEKARRYYAEAQFAPTPHPEAKAGLERVYHQIDREVTTDTFEEFFKDTEAEYRIRESTNNEKIRHKLITNKLTKKATDFRLQTLKGENYTLSEMADKVVLLYVGDSWCGSCNAVIPEVKTAYERFSKNDDVVVWGINDGETPEQVRKFLDKHQPPWPVLLDPRQEVRKAYQIKRIPSFIVIDKTQNWQYSFLGSHLVNGQPLIWMIEALLSD